MLAFHVPCVPPTANHQRKKIVRVGTWTRLADRPELVAAKDMLDALLVPHRPVAPATGATMLTLVFVWPWRKGESKRNRALGRIPRTTKPDCSNAAKTLEDRLVALRFLEDDAIVTRLVVEKYWGDDAGIGVRIEAL
jgi:Holliday junction resolvase RusA-like endonuclease